jgi:Icc-related predicted phosphoesterase
MTQFQLISDLHLDFYSQDVDCILNHIISFQEEHDEPVDALIIAGDLAELRHPVWVSSIQRLAKAYPQVLIVLGNHEYYHANSDQFFKATRSIPDNVTWLDNSSVMVGNTKVAGGTLWFDADCIDSYSKRTFSDFIYIPNLDKWVQADHDQAKQTLMSSDAQVIVTHHAPHPGSIHPEYHGNRLNPFFCTDCSDIIESVQPQYWVHGHTHHPFDYSVGQTRILANPLAYPNERYWSPTNYPPCFFNLP